ncbi:hypothetical protein [Iodobacter fluviatilis]|uniref:Uncharacterized protein n=1 Tax=Iodobacter fluviatilis TaxID=537 RepID=A0A7G3G9K4_9NEIS|nr:hypothetical protein [Iodobacter fluviatilis]QBC43838.1 hypothetical protein C1H71_09945 [Iodobacter fluviatilis]
MDQAIVISEHADTELKISHLGLTLSIAQKVARVASAAKASTLEIDVAFAPGMLAHIYGNRQLRLALLPLGWRLGRFNNVETVINDDLGVQIIFQNVDMACVPSHSPQAISSKGAGSRQLVQKGIQGELWDQPNLNPAAVESQNDKRGVTPSVWMFCVSDDGKRLRAELSKPNPFEGNQLESFSKRIFVLDEETGPQPDIDIKSSSNGDDDEDFDIEVNVARK